MSSLSSMQPLPNTAKSPLIYNTAKPIYLPKAYKFNSFVSTTSHLRNINHVRVPFKKYAITPSPVTSTTPLRGDQQPTSDDHNADDYDYESNRSEKEELPEFYPLANHDYNRIPILKLPLYQTGGLFTLFSPP